MARSFLREGQILDADVLTEDEHSSLVHTNLVATNTTISGDLTVSGTIYCDSIDAINGYTGSVYMVNSITEEGVVSNSLLFFENGILTGVTGQPDTYITTASGSFLQIA